MIEFLKNSSSFNFKKGDLINMTGGDEKGSHVITEVHDKDTYVQLEYRPAKWYDHVKAFIKKWWGKLTYKLIWI